MSEVEIKKLSISVEKKIANNYNHNFIYYPSSKNKIKIEVYVPKSKTM